MMGAYAVILLKDIRFKSEQQGSERVLFGKAKLHADSESNGINEIQVIFKWRRDEKKDKRKQNAFRNEEECGERKTETR